MTRSSMSMRAALLMLCLCTAGAQGGLAVDDARPPLEQGHELLEAGKYKAAMDAYRLAVQTAGEPGLVCSALMGLARCESATYRYEMAEQTLKRVVESCPGPAHAPEAAFLLGLVRFRQQDKSAAVEAFLGIIRNWPTTPAASQALHQVLDHWRGEPEEDRAWQAVGAWLESTTPEQDDWVAVCRRYAMVYLDHGRLEQARELLSRVLDKDSRVLDILRGPTLHRVDPWYRQQRQFRDLIKKLTEELPEAESPFEKAGMAELIGRTWERAGRPERAIDIYNRILERASGMVAENARERIKALSSPFRDRVIELADDRATQGDWIGRYGRAHYILCAMMSPQSVTGGQGPFLSYGRHTANPNERARSWLGVLSTEERRALRNPLQGRRTYASWDDHGEIHPHDDCGPDLLLDLDIPAGLYRLSLYFVDWDAGTGDKPRAHTIVLTDSEGRVMLSAAVSEFADGMYKRFGVVGPLSLTVRINKDYSNSVVVSGVFLDQWEAPALLADAVRAGLPPAEDNDALADARRGYEDFRSLHERDPAAYLQGVGDWRQLIPSLQQLTTQPLGPAESIEARWLLWRACRELPDGLAEAEEAFAQLLTGLAGWAKDEQPGEVSEAGGGAVATYEALATALHEMGEYIHAQRMGDEQVALLIHQGRIAEAEQALEALAHRYLEHTSVHLTSDFSPRDLACDREIDADYAGAKVAELANLVAARSEDPAARLLEMARRNRDQGHARFAQLVYEQIAERYAGQLNIDDLLCWVGSARSKDERRERAGRLERAVPLAADEDDRVRLRWKLANALMELNEIDKATQVVDLLVDAWGSDDPRCANLVYSLAGTYRRVGRRAGAEERYHWVIHNHGASVFARCATRYLEAMGR